MFQGRGGRRDVRCGGDPNILSDFELWPPSHEVLNTFAAMSQSPHLSNGPLRLPRLLGRTDCIITCKVSGVLWAGAEDILAVTAAFACVWEPGSAYTHHSGAGWSPVTADLEATIPPLIP